MFQKSVVLWLFANFAFLTTLSSEVSPSTVAPMQFASTEQQAYEQFAQIGRLVQLLGEALAQAKSLMVAKSFQSEIPEQSDPFGVEDAQQAHQRQPPPQHFEWPTNWRLEMGVVEGDDTNGVWADEKQQPNAEMVSTRNSRKPQNSGRATSSADAERTNDGARQNLTKLSTTTTTTAMTPTTNHADHRETQQKTQDAVEADLKKSKIPDKPMTKFGSAATGELRSISSSSVATAFDDAAKRLPTSTPFQPSTSTTMMNGGIGESGFNFTDALKQGQKHRAKNATGAPPSAVGGIGRHAKAILRILQGSPTELNYTLPDSGNRSATRSNYSGGTSPLFQESNAGTVVLISIALLLLAIIILSLAFVYAFQRHVRHVEKRVNSLQRRASGVFAWSTSDSFRSAPRKSFTASSSDIVKHTE